MYVLDTNAFYYAAGISECTYDVEKLQKLVDENEVFISSTSLFEFLINFAMIFRQFTKVENTYGKRK